MRFLKNKIAAAQASGLKKEKNNSLEQTIEREYSININRPKVPGEHSPFKTSKQKAPTKKNRRPLGSSCVPKASREIKNLVKNYGKAICNFSTSPLAASYLTAFVKAEGVQLRDFLQFAEKSKTKIDGLNHFREILLSRDDDDNQTAAYRRIYKQISEVFIKFFSVNWIFHSKVKYKKAHLNFRFKMLRRIRSPELFTYLKGPKRLLSDLD